MSLVEGIRKGILLQVVFTLPAPVLLMLFSSLLYVALVWLAFSVLAIAIGAKLLGSEARHTGLDDLFLFAAAMCRHSLWLGTALLCDGSSGVITLLIAATVWTVWRCKIWCDRWYARSDDGLRKDHEAETYLHGNTLTANSRYQDVSGTSVMVVLLFGSQMMLLVFVCSGLLETDRILEPGLCLSRFVTELCSSEMWRELSTILAKPHDLTLREWIFWFSAGVLRTMAEDTGEVARPYVYDLPFFLYLIEKKPTHLVEKQPEHLRIEGQDERKIPCPSRLELKFRMAMCVAVNGITREIILSTMPLMLMNSETYMDFVKDAFAMLFVLKLDDLGEGKVFAAVDEDAERPLLSDASDWGQ